MFNVQWGRRGCVEKVDFEFWVEESGSGWWQRWWWSRWAWMSGMGRVQRRMVRMRSTEWSRKFISKTSWCISEFLNYIYHILFGMYCWFFCRFIFYILSGFYFKFSCNKEFAVYRTVHFRSLLQVPYVLWHATQWTCSFGADTVAVAVTSEDCAVCCRRIFASVALLQHSSQYKWLFAATASFCLVATVLFYSGRSIDCHWSNFTALYAHLYCHCGSHRLCQEIQNKYKWNKIKALFDPLVN